MSKPRLSKKQRKAFRDKRRQRQNKRSSRAGEYGIGRTEDRKKEYEQEAY